MLSYDFQVIALFNANEHEQAIQRIRELSSTPHTDPIPFRIVEVSILPRSVPGAATNKIFLRFAHQAYLHVELGRIALQDDVLNFGMHEIILPKLHADDVASAVDHFTTAVNASSFFFGLPIHTKYEVFIEVR